MPQNSQSLCFEQSLNLDCVHNKSFFVCPIFQPISISKLTQIYFFHFRSWNQVSKIRNLAFHTISISPGPLYMFVYIFRGRATDTGFDFLGSIGTTFVDTSLKCGNFFQNPIWPPAAILNFLIFFSTLVVFVNIHVTHHF